MGFPSARGRTQGNRHFNRLRLGVSAMLILTHDSRACLIDDISRTGARLRIDRALTERQAVILAFHELRVFATVKWSRGRECGLQFDQPLDPEDMRGMLWIKENRELYARICDTGRAMDWSEGIGD